jgi:peptidoglycan/xylan/chitin deacetylase (PgdA/CDA1 family)
VVVEKESMARSPRRAPLQLGVAAICVVIAAGCAGALGSPLISSTATGSPPAPCTGPPSPGETTAPSIMPTTPGGPTAGPTVAPSCTPSPIATAPPTPVETSRPTAAPTPRPTVRPTQTPEPTAVASRLITHGSRTSGKVALTYDMGGRVGDAIAIMNWLVDHRTHASIFMTGAMADNVNTDAGRIVLGIIEQHPDLFTLGNHSYTHRDFRTLTAAEIRDELRRTETAIAPHCSQDLHPFFRPPNGGYDADVLAAVGTAGYRYTVTWDVDTIDWRPVANDPPGPTADQIVAKVLGNAQSGSIVLNHLGGYHTYAALPRVVAGLLDRGYDLVTLDELLGT